MRVSDEFLQAVRTRGFAIMEGFLSPEEVGAARDALFAIYPRPEQYFADRESFRHLVANQFSGLTLAPFGSPALDQLAVHPDLVDAAERFCGTTDLQVYKIELWAKYSGSVDYDQPHHRDFGNHNLVVPRADGRWPQLTSFILLSDVTEEDGPTQVVPRAVGDREPMTPALIETGRFADEEVPVIGPAGTLFSYTTDVFHRGSAMTGHERSRFALLSDFSERGNPWMGKMSWPNSANQRAWVDMITRASVRERDLFGFPPPGHEYWNDQTLHDVGRRYPGMDMEPYIRATG
jgi:Phytanoyl-CoA dioxygenase (PhyH)